MFHYAYPFSPQELPTAKSTRSEDLQRPLHWSRLISEHQTLDGHQIAEDKHVKSDESASVAQLQRERPATDASDVAVPEINEQMTSVASPRNSRPRRIEVSTDQTAGAPEALELLNKFAILEAATSVLNVSHEIFLIENNPPLEEVF